MSANPIQDIFFSYVEANGIRHRLASTVPDIQKNGPSFRQEGYPLVLFLHGFPESWYSWRLQLLCLRNQSFLPVAPDMRGFGSTSQPKRTEDYTQPIIALDVVGIAKALGYEQFIVVGHDWGAQAAWSVALLYPQCVLGVFAMSVPYTGTPKMDMLKLLQLKFGPSLDTSIPRTERLKSSFHYMLHHCLPRSTEEYNQNGREFLFRMYAQHKGCDVVKGTPEHDMNGRMFDLVNTDDNQGATLDASVAPGLWKRLPKPKTLPSWLHRRDLEYITGEFERAGFHGGLCWYRAMPLNYELMRDAPNQVVFPPSFFVMGENDDLINLYGGKDKILHRLGENLLQMTKEPMFLKDTGHWIQVENYKAVNKLLLDFLDAIVSKTEQERSLLGRRKPTSRL